MKRIVNGVTYNTATSSRLAESHWNGDDGTVFGALYQTRGGAFFVDAEITRQVWNEDDRRHESKVEHVFAPQSPEEAHNWLLEGDVEVFINPFDDPPEATAEAEPGATIYIRVPASLKRLVDEAAQNAKVSGNVWAMRCVERCLNPNPDAKEELATAYYILDGIGAAAGGVALNLANEAMEQIQSAWGDLGFDDPSEHSDISTRIVSYVSELTKERLRREHDIYPEEN
jgi:hypothetical protein